MRRKPMEASDVFVINCVFLAFLGDVRVLVEAERGAGFVFDGYYALPGSCNSKLAGAEAHRWGAFGFASCSAARLLSALAFCASMRLAMWACTATLSRPAPRPSQSLPYPSLVPVSRDPLALRSFPPARRPPPARPAVLGALLPARATSRHSLHFRRFWQGVVLRCHHFRACRLRVRRQGRARGRC